MKHSYDMTNIYSRMHIYINTIIKKIFSQYKLFNFLILLIFPLIPPQYFDRCAMMLKFH